MSYKDIKVTSNGGFYVESKDIFKNKQKSLQTLKKLKQIFDKYRNKPFPFY